MLGDFWDRWHRQHCKQDGVEFRGFENSLFGSSCEAGYGSRPLALPQSSWRYPYQREKQDEYLLGPWIKLFKRRWYLHCPSTFHRPDWLEMMLLMIWVYNRTPIHAFRCVHATKQHTPSRKTGWYHRNCSRYRHTTKYYTYCTVWFRISNENKLIVTGRSAKERVIYHGSAATWLRAGKTI